MSKTILTAALVSAAALGLSACDVQKTQEGNVNLPKYEVSKTQEGNVQVPKYDVQGPDVKVGSTEKQVTVPNVDVDVNKEKKSITVPKVDVTTPSEKQGGQREQRADASNRQ